MSKSPTERMWFGVMFLTLTITLIGVTALTYYGYETVRSSPMWIQATFAPAFIWGLLGIAYLGTKELVKGVRQWRTA